MKIQTNFLKGGFKMYILGIDELVALEEGLFHHLRKEIVEINRRGELANFFEFINFSYFTNEKEDIQKVLVIGHSQAKISELRNVVMSKGMNLENFEFIINYEEISQYDFSHIKQGNHYKYILVGPMAHNQKGLKKNTSMIVDLEKQEHLSVIRIEDFRGKLDLTKTSFARALENIY